MDTRPLGKPSDFSSAQDAWRDLSAVFRGYAGAAVMTEAAKAATPIQNATILEEDDRASVGTALLDDAHDLQGCSSQHRVSGGEQ